MPNQKVDYQKINSLKGKWFDVSRKMEQTKNEGMKVLEPYNIALANLEKDANELLKQIEEEESKIKK